MCSAIDDDRRSVIATSVVHFESDEASINTVFDVVNLELCMVARVIVAESSKTEENEKSATTCVLMISECDGLLMALASDVVEEI